MTKAEMYWLRRGHNDKLQRQEHGRVRCKYAYQISWIKLYLRGARIGDRR
jgi:hypothetical protein